MATLLILSSDKVIFDEKGYFKNPSIAKREIAKDGMNLSKVRPKDLTDEMCIEALRNNINALQFISYNHIKSIKSRLSKEKVMA